VTLLIDLIVRNEDPLLGEVLSLAETNGYLRFVTGTPAGWRATVRGLSGSLLQSLRSDPSPPALAADDAGKFATFWREFGAVFKEGLAEDLPNQQKIAELLRFNTTRSSAASCTSTPTARCSSAWRRARRRCAASASRWR